MIQLGILDKFWVPLGHVRILFYYGFNYGFMMAVIIFPKIKWCYEESLSGLK